MPKSLQRRNSRPGYGKRTAEPFQIETGVPNWFRRRTFQCKVRFMKSSASEPGLTYDITPDFNPFTMWTFYLKPWDCLLVHPNSFPGFSPMDAWEWTRGSTIRRTKYRQTSLYGHPLNTDTPLIQTLSMVPPVSVLTGFDCTVLLKSRLQISIRWYSGQKLQHEPNYDLVILKCRTRICETRGKCKRSGTSYHYRH